MYRRHSASPERARSWSWRTSALAEIQQAAGTEPLQLGDDRLLESDHPDEPSWRWPWRRSGRHDPAGRWRRRTNQICPRASSGRLRVGADALQPSQSRRGPRSRAARATPRLERRHVRGRSRRINLQAASTDRNRCSSAARGSAPTTRSISCPSRITISNGIDCAPNLVASPGFASTSTFTTLRSPA